MKPGDLIEWWYDYGNHIVSLNDKLWSSTMNCWVPIGIVSMLLHCDKKTYSWINTKGCFHARRDDRHGTWSSRQGNVVVHKCNKKFRLI